MELSVHISANCDRTFHLLHIWFFSENFLGLKFENLEQINEWIDQIIIAENIYSGAKQSYQLNNLGVKKISRFSNTQELISKISVIMYIWLVSFFSTCKHCLLDIQNVNQHFVWFLHRLSFIFSRYFYAATELRAELWVQISWFELLMSANYSIVGLFEKNKIKRQLRLEFEKFLKKYNSKCLCIYF